MITIKITYDENACVWIATSKEIGLVIESFSYNLLIEKILFAAPEIARENNVECKKIKVETESMEIDV